MSRTEKARVPRACRSDQLAATRPGVALPPPRYPQPEPFPDAPEPEPPPEPWAPPGDPSPGPGEPLPPEPMAEEEFGR